MIDRSQEMTQYTYDADTTNNQLSATIYIKCVPLNYYGISDEFVLGLVVSH